MVEERGGVVLDNTSAVDSDHVIRLVVEEVSIVEILLCRLLVRTELHPNKSYDLFQYRWQFSVLHLSLPRVFFPVM